ncbi:MAG: nitroreductase family protein, partial [Muribaculaceae bacterium]
ATQGVQSKSKTVEKVSKCSGDMPEWFRNGVEAALLAPSAVNQQKFRFELVGDRVRATTGWGFYPKVDLGIAKLHFELGSGKPSTIWL